MRRAPPYGLKPSARTELCDRCGSISSNALCQACALLDTLNAGALQLTDDKLSCGSKAAEQQSRAPLSMCA